MKFESELKKGNFLLSECSNCQKIVWPPSEYCDNCLKEVNWKKSSGIGTILEYSKQNDRFFCVVEIDNSVRIMGQIISGIPDIGKRVTITDCKIENQNYVVNLAVLD